jgi:putative RNA 2'-phosphotransferase
LRSHSNAERLFVEGKAMSERLRTRVSKYASYLLRHNPRDLGMDGEGFVQLKSLLSKIRSRYPTVDAKLLIKMIHSGDKKRFDMAGDKVRALYGHTIDVRLRLKEDEEVKVLYHGTTPEAAHQILRSGLSMMRRRWVHLSPTKEVALEVGRRRTNVPVVLSIDAREARNGGIRFYRSTDIVYLCRHVPAKYIRRVTVP